MFDLNVNKAREQWGGNNMNEKRNWVLCDAHLN